MTALLIIAGLMLAPAQDVVVMRRVIAPATPSKSPVTTPGTTPVTTPTPDPSPSPTPPAAPHWATTEWTTSAPGCADFTSTREARCMIGTVPQVDETACGRKPDTTQVVKETSTCGYNWTTTLYTPTSGCGRGVKQTRTAVCSHLLYYGSVAATDQALCTRAKPPLETTVDLADDCRGIWEPDWQPVDASTCEGTIQQPGVQTCRIGSRQVDEYNCTGKPKPADETRTVGCTNLALNGGFESTAAWLIYERTSYNANMAYVRSGTRSIYAYSPTSNYYGPYQLVTNLVKGRSYTIAAWYMATASTQSRCIKVQLERLDWKSGSGSTKAIVADAKCSGNAIPWTKVSTTFTATDTDVRIGYLVNNNTGTYKDGGVYFDDVSLTAN